MDGITRRNILNGAITAGGTAFLSRSLSAQVTNGQTPKPKLQVALFSKHLQFLTGEELAKTTVAIGFDAINVTVRAGGHVQPENVARDLPPLVNILREHGLKVHMVTTDIVDARSPYAADIFKTMAALRIHHYRWGNLRYAAHQSFSAQLEQMKPRVAALVKLSSPYQVCGLYQIESGAKVDPGTGRVGAAVLDLYMLLKDFDSKTIGVNYDLGHAMEAGNSGAWSSAFRLMSPCVLGLAVKDFDWVKDASGVWRPQLRPMGQGSVPFPQFFQVAAEVGFSGLVEMHFEYLMGGETDTTGKGLANREELYSGMKRDLATLRGYLLQADL